MFNNDLLPLEEIVELSKKKNVDFGSGEPYNRLRYYTKLGWIPNMIRKKDEEGIVRGHYPKQVVFLLTKIDKYKKAGLDNDQITKKISIYAKLFDLLIQDLQLFHQVTTKCL
jgi:hypothetical protein